MNASQDPRLASPNRPDSDELIELLYPELRKLAGVFLHKERPGHTLQPTALIHEAYLRLIRQSRSICKSRTFFFAVASRVMRQVLVEYARQRSRGKRGGSLKKVTLDENQYAPPTTGVEVIALHEAMEKLTALDQRAAQVVELRYFGGLTVTETSDVLGISSRAVAEDWKTAKTWLRKELRDGNDDEP